MPWIGGGSDAGKKIELKSGYALPHDENVGAVVVGFDREINYHKIQYAQLCINENPGCEFIATNLDAVTHLTDAQEWAGNGAMAGAIKGCTGREPTLVGAQRPCALARRDICPVYAALSRSHALWEGGRRLTACPCHPAFGCAQASRRH